ncbi:MAG: gamma-glutamylcyclotransferase family protein [Pseudomonadota bacterium]
MAQYYFGYGSLVNGATRQPEERAATATLQGWRRTWTHFYTAPWGPGRSLSIEEAPETQIDGVLVALTDGALARLDERERGYDRLELDGALLTGLDGANVDSFYVYRSASPWPDGGLDAHPITRSYVDCVMQGYRVTFGDAGLTRFLQTTSAWGGALKQDRDAPTYPRAVALSPEEAELFDERLAEVRPGNN